MKTRSRLLLVVLLVGLVAFGGYRLLVGIAYSTPEIVVASVGGSWKTVRTRLLGGTSWGHTALYRDSDGERVLVADLIGRVAYIGSDCVVYSVLIEVAGSSCRVACGDLPPVDFIPMRCISWSVEDGVFQLRRYTSSGVAETQSFSVGELIRLAEST